MLDVRRAAAKLLLFVVVVMAWRAMPLRLLKLMAGLGRAVPQGLQAKPGGDTRPRANHRPRVDDGRDPAEVRCMQPLEGVDLEGHAVACRPPPRSRLSCQESRKQSRPCDPSLVAQCVENVALRYGMIKPGFVLPHSTPNGPVPREEGGGGAVPWVSTDDSPNVRDNSAKRPEDDGHVRPLAKMQHQVAHLFTTRQASHPGKHEPDLDQRAVSQACTCRERALAPQNVVHKLVHRARRLISAALAGRLLVASWASTTLTPGYMADGKGSPRIMPVAKKRFEKIVAESEGAMSPQLEW